MKRKDDDFPRDVLSGQNCDTAVARLYIFNIRRLDAGSAILNRYRLDGTAHDNLCVPDATATSKSV